MTATEQNPPLAGVDGSASAQVTLNLRRSDEGEMVSAFVTFTVNVNVVGQEDVTLVAMHIHEAPLGANGGIRIRSGLEFGSESVVAMGGSARIWRQVEIVDKDGLATVGRLLDNPAGFYLNIHSESNPGGLLRGQVFNTDRLASMISKVQSQSDALVDGQEFTSDILRRIAFRLGVLRRGE